MYPMISQIEEVRRANALLEECREDLTTRGIPQAQKLEIGTMIEVPAAALIADQLAREVDFFSIGTNDLVQYVMAADRGNERIAELYQSTHPSVLRLIRMVAEAAHEQGIWIGMCGEMASDIQLTPLLLGLGLDELSVVTAAVPRVKKAVQSLDLTDCRKLAEHVDTMTSSSEIEETCREYAKQRYPQLFDC